MYFEVFVLFNVVLLLLAAYAKPPLQYYIKNVIFMYFYTLSSIIVLPFFFLRGKNTKNLRDTSRLWGLPSIPLGIKYQLRGKENLRQNKSGMVIFNHQSAVDMISFSRHLAEIGNTSPIGRSLIRFLGPWGLCGIMCDVVFIDRTKGKEAMRRIREQVQKLKNSNSKLLIFPEGTRNDNGSLLPFKPGGFRIAIENKLPIMPYVISPYYFLNHKKKIFDSGKVIIQILPEIPTEGLTLDDVEALKEKTRDLMMETFESLKKEVESEEFRRLKPTNSLWEKICNYFIIEF